MFTVTGELIGDTERTTRQVYWKNGNVGGDELAVVRWKRAAHDAIGRGVGPIEGPYTYTAHLSSPLSALFLAYDVFVNPVFGGDVPERPEIPEDAIG